MNSELNLLLDAHIEAVLFWKGEPVSLKKLGAIFDRSVSEIESALASMEEKLHNRGITLVRKDDEVALAVSGNSSSCIQKLAKDELADGIGKAGLETLSIIIYRGPVTRKDIDYIRGVNSNFILRNLLVRGLVERIDNPKDQRSFLYRPTFELLSYLGLQKISDMPEYEAVQNELKEREAQAAEEAGDKDANDDHGGSEE